MKKLILFMIFAAMFIACADNNVCVAPEYTQPEQDTTAVQDTTFEPVYDTTDTNSVTPDTTSETPVYYDVIIGGREKQYVLWAEKFEKFCDHVYIATDNGEVGTKGFVTDVLQKLIDDGEKFDEVIAIGPVIMMKNVVRVTKPYNIPTSVSLNPIMVDGTGMCGCCRVTVDGKIKFACVDGPDFDGLTVDFDELMARQRMFKEEEHHVNENADRICNLMRGVE